MTASTPEATIAKIAAEDTLPVHLRGVITQAQRYGERLTEMTINADGHWDFSDLDIAALVWTVQRIANLDTEVMRLRALRPAR